MRSSSDSSSEPVSEVSEDFDIITLGSVAERVCVRLLPPARSGVLKLWTMLLLEMTSGLEMSTAAVFGGGEGALRTGIWLMASCSSFRL